MNTLRCDPQATLYSCVNPGVASDNLFVAGDMNIEPNASGMLADTFWHRLDFHLKMNTYNSGSSTWNSDGVYQFSYDGLLKENHSDIQWKRDSPTEIVGWNAFDLGGNANNNYNNDWIAGHTYNVNDSIMQNSYSWKALQTHVSTNSDKPAFTSNAYWQKMGLIEGQKEQWYAIDDVVVSTTAIPDDYVIGNIDISAPYAPSGLVVQ